MGASATSFARKWQSGSTQVIRVPESMAERLMAIARQWDTTGVEPIAAYSVAESSPVYQLGLPNIPRLEPGRPVNVSSVPQLSPFRYPGGKTWLIPTIRAWLLHTKPKRLFEPFAGGAIVSLTAAAENLVDEVVFCELDGGVAAVWKTILSDDCHWLIDRILSFDLNEKNVREELAVSPTDTKARALQTILRNRVQRGGIMAPGAGFVKTGEGGKGLGSRWYPETLARRLLAIHEQRERLHFIHGDAFSNFRRYGNAQSSAMYVDPPYVKAARRLYSCWSVDHQAIFERCRDLRGDVLMSYDHTSEVTDWATQMNFDTRAISMKNTHHATMSELLIGKDMSWFDLNSKVAA